MLQSQSSGFPITVTVAGTAGTSASSSTPVTVAPTASTPVASAAPPSPGLAYTGSPASFDLALAFAIVLLGGAVARAAHVLPAFRLPDSLRRAGR
jgi:hypothetical protein